ncbi:unnamed protein product [Leptidea sinapis]|uniref:IMD domain-containing protein n=1 Tax=Leptidea sinapis TaxID=189913 RepID=A0A5E4Q6M0_9NEOP|nr:unnamed protein product [Leptidea sinapis]
MWEEFISKATKLHSALKSALVAIAAFLDAFQKIADAATNARVTDLLASGKSTCSLILLKLWMSLTAPQPATSSL